MQNFQSVFALTDIVHFRPMEKHQEEQNISGDLLTGKIVGVSFYEGDTTYDLYCEKMKCTFKKVDINNLLKYPHTVG